MSEWFICNLRYLYAEQIISCIALEQVDIMMVVTSTNDPKSSFSRYVGDVG